MTVQLQYTVDGPPDAPVLVLGSSLGTTGAMWQPQMEELTAQFRVVRYDHRGHGKSPVPQGPYDLEDLGRDVLALLDKLHVPRVHLGGASLGGMVAMWVAAHAPARVGKLVLLSTSAQLGPPSIWTDRIAAVESGGMPAIVDAILARWFTPLFAREHPAVVGWVQRMLSTTPVAGYVGCCAAIATMDLTPVLPAIVAPTLLISASGDPATPTSHLEAIAALIPGSRLEVVPGAAHLVNIEKPAVVNSLMTGFLA